MPSTYLLLNNVIKIKIVVFWHSAFLTGTIVSFIIKYYFMSQAFVKEEDDQWLHEIPGTLTALIHYLIKENNGIRIYGKNTLIKMIKKYMK